MRLQAAYLSYEWTQSHEFQNSKGHDVLDAKLTSWNRKPKMYEGKLGELQPKGAPRGFVVDTRKNYMDWNEQSTCKFILNIDGHVKAFRLGNELRYGSVILLVDSPYTLWFQTFMEPMVHYIPVKFDLSDLRDQLTWCLAHDAECQQIAHNSLKFYETHLTADKTFAHFDTLLTDLHQLRLKPMAKLLKPNKQTMHVVGAYRDSGDNYRSKHLSIFIKQMKAIFEPRTTLKILIIEQEGDREDYESLPSRLKQPNTQMARFNLGRLKNIGYHIASQDHTPTSYYVLSDVDLLPSEALIPSYLEFPKRPIHLGHRGTRYEVPTNKGKNKGKKRTFLGGVVSFGKPEFEKANGYPNNFWGWGGEDDALNHRLNTQHIQVTQPDAPVIDLEELTREEKNQILKQQEAKEERKWEKVDADTQHWKTNGLSNLEGSYEILNDSLFKHHENVRHLLVQLNITEADAKVYA